MAEKNQIKLKETIFSSPLLDLEQKRALYSSFLTVSDEDVLKVEAAFLEAENLLFSRLADAGLDFDQVKGKTKTFFRNKIQALEDHEHSREEADIESKLKELWE